MATEPKVTSSTRLWSDEVAIAAAGDPLSADKDPSVDPGYEFSNGRKFNSGKGAYANPVEPVE